LIAKKLVVIDVNDVLAFVLPSDGEGSAFRNGRIVAQHGNEFVYDNGAKEHICFLSLQGFTTSVRFQTTLPSGHGLIVITLSTAVFLEDD